MLVQSAATECTHQTVKSLKWWQVKTSFISLAVNSRCVCPLHQCLNPASAKILAELDLAEFAKNGQMPDLHKVQYISRKFAI